MLVSCDILRLFLEHDQAWGHGPNIDDRADHHELSSSTRNTPNGKMQHRGGPLYDFVLKRLNVPE